MSSSSVKIGSQSATTVDRWRGGMQGTCGTAGVRATRARDAPTPACTTVIVVKPARDAKTMRAVQNTNDQYYSNMLFLTEQ